MKMVNVPSITVAAGETLVLQPGGYHLMLFGLKKPIKGRTNRACNPHYARRHNDSDRGKSNEGYC